MIDITATYLLAQLCSLLAAICVLAAPQFKNHRLILMADLPASLLWALHYLLLGGMAGFWVAFFAFFRTCLCLKTQEAWHKGIIIGYLLVVTIAVTLQWQGLMSLIPILGTAAFSIGFLFANNTTIVRASMIISCTLWFAYAVHIGSIMQMLAYLSFVTSGLVGLRHTRSLQAAE